MFRTILAVFLLSGFAAGAAASDRTYPLWDGRESVASYAARVGLAPEKLIDLGGGVKLELVLIPAGRFMMGTAEPTPPSITVLSGQIFIGVGAGLALVLIALLIFRKRPGRRFSFSLRWLMAFCLACSVMVWGGTRWHLALKEIQEFEAAMARFARAEDNEKPARSVLISKPFYMGKYAVTQEQYQAVVGNNPSYFKGAMNPVEKVSWEDAVAFCERVKSKTGVNTQLPSEAQREYACRAGTMTMFNTGDTLDQANYEGHGAVGSFKPNEFGLYDMHGNIIEWCHDFYGENYYKENIGNDPLGPIAGTERTLRGRSLYHDEWGCRSAKRHWGAPGIRDVIIGFRVCASLD